MQNTRFNTILDEVGDRTVQLINNPWRRVSIVFIGLLVGFFLGSAIPSTTGQMSIWDVPAAAVVMLIIEGLSRFIYSRSRLVRSGITARRTFFLDAVNSIKMGMTYGLFLEAFKLNS
ncbi:DUF565 domain-containing protein [Spirulina subsalsa]|uniref:DUF565 domain-containing protein n=1 Tax=Spirulina subsalsa TaxID=54311 RepID=UPI00030A8EE6|nr:DUF565 domain-containing protein [Spirulina subsalsa]